MPKPKIVSDYLEAAVPKGLTASRRKLITQELESHIYDKAEHYIEIGYTEEESFEKAVAEMGDAEAVNESFEKVYRESRFKAAAAFIGITAANLLSVLLGFGFSILYFADNAGLGSEYYFESHILSTLAVYFIFISILSSYKNGNCLKLKAIGFANLLMSLTPGFFNNLYQPFAVVLSTVFCRLIKIDLTFQTTDTNLLICVVGGEIVSIIFCVLSFVLSSKKQKIALSEEKEATANKFRKITAAVLAPVLVLTLTAFVYLNIKNDAGYDFAVSEMLYMSDTEKAKDSAAKLYDSLNDSLTFTQADKMLKNAGYIASTEVEKAVTDKDEIEHAFTHLEENYSFNPQKEVAYFSYFESNYLCFDNIIILKNTGDKPLREKKHLGIMCGYSSGLNSFIVFNNTSIPNCQKGFEKLFAGQEKTKALKSFRRTCGLDTKWIETSLKDGDVIETYHFDELFSEFLSNNYSTVDVEIVFTNAILTKGSFTLYEYMEEYDAETDKESYKEKRTVITLPQ
ncbi:MAG: permease prefix domain 1-containing protein [Acutalibacteraceae bacterium]